MVKKVTFRTKSGKLVSFTPKAKKPKRASTKALNTSSIKVMARRRFRPRVVYRRAKSSFRRSRKNPNSELNQLMGVAAFAIAKPTIDSTIANITSKTGVNVPPEMIELLLAWKLKNKGGIIGSASKAAYYISLYNLTKNFIPALNLGNIFAAGSNGTTTSGDQWAN